MSSTGGERRLRIAALALAVGVVLADSSVVVLALPEIFRQFETSVSGVSWVLIVFNLSLALVAVPAASWAKRRGPGRVAAIGLAVFAGASLACGLSTDLASLITARAVQGLGGAATVTAALELLSISLGSDRRAIPIWVGAGAIGAALGPAIGGLLTEFVSWQSIFLIQVPVCILCGVPLFGVVVEETREWVKPTLANEGRPHLPANLALAMVSAGIAATLFLVVILLIEGWGLTPVGAAIVVSVVPVSTLIGARLGGNVADPRHRAAAGAILLAGGLAGLAFLPKALVVLTVPPQILAGLGLALVLSALTETALHGRSDGALHAGWTMTSRHAGVVVGLILLTPIFTSSLETQRDAALDAGTAILLDADLPAGTKLDLAQRLPEELRKNGDRQMPEISAAFDPLPTDPEERGVVVRMRHDLQGQIDRAATHAFSTSFLIAALVALLALVPILSTRRLEL